MKVLLSLIAISSIYLSSTNANAQQCAGQPVYAANSDFVVPVANNEIKIMNYNVENLFDAKHQQGREDYEFLPLSSPEKVNCNHLQGYYRESCKNLDWTDEKYLVKLNQIRNVLAAQGELPDVMGVEEVENGEVVAMLSRALGFEYYTHTTGSDNRIELGVLYNERKLTFKEGAELEIQFPQGGVKHTRNILVVHFTLKSDPSKILGVYINHWPSQGSPSIARVQAAATLRQGIDYFTQMYGVQNYHVVALGDFNTVDTDNPHPFQTLADQTWPNMVYDADYVYYSTGYKQDPQQMQSKMPPGTYFYGKDRQWNKLDHMFLSRNLLDGQGLEMEQNSYRVIAPDFMLGRYEDRKAHFCYDGVPLRYNHSQTNPMTAGYSDHFPIVMKLRMQ